MSTKESLQAIITAELMRQGSESGNFAEVYPGNTMSLDGEFDVEELAVAVLSSMAVGKAND